MSLIALAFAAALSGQDPCADIWSDECRAVRDANPDCFDDNLTNRCAEPEQARVRALLEIASAEAELEAGVEMYRVFFVDGYGNDMPAVTLERRPGASPRVVVNGSEGRRLSGAVSTEVWTQIRAGARYVDRELASRTPAGPDDTVQMCLHSWVVTVEIAEPSPHDSSIPGLRRKTQDACEDGLAVQYAFGLAKAAIEALHPCNELDPNQHRNDVARLSSCLGLEGDQLAAIEFLNGRERGANRIPADQTADAWGLWLGFSNTRNIDWNGVRVVETPARPGVLRISVASFLAERSAELGEMWLGVENLRGDSSTQISVGGEIWISDRVDPSNTDGLKAPYLQTWRAGRPGDGWRLESWTVGAFSRVEPRDD